MVIFRERNEGDAEKFEAALKKAKKGIAEACEIFEEMKEEFSERRGGYSERGSYGERGGSYGERWTPSEDGMQWRGGMSRRDYDDMYERRYRDGMGRYR